MIANSSTEIARLGKYSQSRQKVQARSAVPQPTKEAGTLRRAVRSQAFEGF
jgi:hypothetical protein